ncbi:ATP-binding cassette domain-containing protein [Rhizobium yanglingense]
MLENVHLSFYPDAKIGILGPNGAGKSTVLQHHGRPRQGIYRRGLARRGRDARLPRRRSRSSTRTKTVLENVMEGVATKTAVLDRYNELMMNYSDETADEGAKLQDIIDSQNLWDLENQVEMAMDALRCPPGDASAVTGLSGGETPPRGALPPAACRSRTCCSSTNRPTTSTPRPSPGSKSTCATIPAPC